MAIPNTLLGAEGCARLLADVQRLYFLGIGGVSMFSLAALSLARGLTVGGSDRTESALTRQLSQWGARVWIGHDSRHPLGYQALVYTAAVSESTPELQSARAMGIPVLSRADYLAYLMAGARTRVGIAGMHGKSTVCAMIGHLFEQGGQDPTVACGALMKPHRSPLRQGGSDCFVFESDEYMRSFHSFSPTLSVLNNLELDHTDCYPDLDAVKAAFLTYLHRTESGGTAVLNADDPHLMDMAASYGGRRVLFSLSDPAADCHATALQEIAGRPVFSLVWQGREVGRVSLRLPGRHNVYNALAAAAAALSGGIPPDTVTEALGTFGGVCRRMELRGYLHGAPVYDDYAHHPNELRATLHALRPLTPGRLFCVFQSHTYSRTASFFAELAEALRLADYPVVADVYAARESDTRGMSAAALAAAAGGPAVAISGFEGIAEHLRSAVCAGDTVVVMGAGDIDRVFEHLTLTPVPDP
ncbi:MAG: UDP-N-acetylmuramate--L-alanine ligase [Eubacteriales bacterium]